MYILNHILFGHGTSPTNRYSHWEHFFGKNVLLFGGLGTILKPFVKF